MKKALLALGLLAAGCAGNGSQEMETVTVQHHHRQTKVVAQKPLEAAPPLRLVNEPTPASTPQPVPRPQPTPPPTPQAQPPTIDFLQVGPPVVLNTAPTPTPSLNLTVAPPQAPYQPPPLPLPSPSAAPTYNSVLETAPGFSYQNGGVNGTTRPPISTPTPDLPTAEGFQYRP